MGESQLLGGIWQVNKLWRKNLLLRRFSVRYWWTTGTLAVQNQVFFPKFESPLEQDAQNWPHMFFFFPTIDTVQHCSATRPCSVGLQWSWRTCFHLLLLLSDQICNLKWMVRFVPLSQITYAGLATWLESPVEDCDLAFPRRTLKHKDLQ